MALSHWGSGSGIYHHGSDSVGISNVQKYSYGDTRNGGPTGNPKQAYADELAPFFGRVQVYEPPPPYDGFKTETYDLPAAHKGNNAYLRRVTIDSITTAEQYPTIELMPWQWTDKMSIAWEVWHFGQYMMGRTPEESVSRLVTSSFKSNKADMHRWGLGLKLEHGFYKTPMGKTCYAMSMMQIRIAAIETLNLNVMDACYNAKPYRSAFSSGGMEKQDLEDAFNNEKRYWGIIHKERNAFGVIETYAAKEMKERHGMAGNHVTIPAGTRAALTERPENQLYILEGPMNKEPFSGGKVQIRESRGFTVTGSKSKLDPAINTRVIGGYFYLTLGHLQERDMKTFNNGMLDSYIWDEELDDMYRFSFMDNYHKAGLWENWNTSSNHQQQQQKQSSLLGQYNEDDDTDNFWENDAAFFKRQNTGSQGAAASPSSSSGGDAKWSPLGYHWLSQVLPMLNPSNLTADELYKDTTWGTMYTQVNLKHKLALQIVNSHSDKLNDKSYHNMWGKLDETNTLRLIYKFLNDHGIQAYQTPDQVSDCSIIFPRVEQTRKAEHIHANVLDKLYSKGTIVFGRDNSRAHAMTVLLEFLHDLVEHPTIIPAATAGDVTSMDAQDAVLKKLYGPVLDKSSWKYIPNTGVEGVLQQLVQLALDKDALFDQPTPAVVNNTNPANPANPIIVTAAIPSTITPGQIEGKWATKNLPAFQQPLRPIYDWLVEWAKKPLAQTDDDAFWESALADFKTQFNQTTPRLNAPIAARLTDDAVRFTYDQILHLLDKHAKINNVEFYKSMVQADLYPCIGLLCFRPYQRWKMGSVLYTFSGGVIGSTWYTDPDFMLGDNIAQKLHEGHFTMYAKAVITQPDRIMTIDDVLGVKYLGGWSHSIWDASDADHKKSHKSGYFKYDMYVCAVPINFTPDDNYIDITGKPHECLKASIHTAKAKTQGSYTGSVAYATYWGWTQNRTAVDPTDGRLNTQKRFNTLCFQDHQTLYNDGKFQFYRINKGHWGERLYPGCAHKHTQAGIYLEPVNYKNTSVVAIGV
jgi:hypothetical protein